VMGAGRAVARQYRARFGDHEQVSPSAVGRLLALFKTSSSSTSGESNSDLYDVQIASTILARQSFAARPSRRAFPVRSVDPPFSNMISTRPLKPCGDASRVQLAGRTLARIALLAPPATARLTPGSPERRFAPGRPRWSNPNTGRMTRARLSIGVVSRLATSQAIDSTTYPATSSPDRYELHRVSCGNARRNSRITNATWFCISLFGHARTWFSLPARPGTLQTAFPRRVAAPRDQMWIVHSLTPQTT